MKTKKISLALAGALAMTATSLAAPTLATAQPAAPALPPLPGVAAPGQPGAAPALPLTPGAVDVANAVDPALRTGQVNPDAPNNYVSFGDSTAANPTILDIQMDAARNRGQDVKWPTLQEGKCAQDPNNFPRQVARQTGLRLDDYSCAGLTAYTQDSPLVPGKKTNLDPYVDRAIADGALNANTRLVSVIIGFNEFYQRTSWNMTEQQRAEAYRNAITPLLLKIKAAAPNAKVMMLGYPDETDGMNNTCGSNLLGVVTHWYFPLIAAFQDELYAQQRTSADAAGVQYLPFKDWINVRNGNSGCLGEGPRLNAAIFDDSNHRISMHLTDNGHKFYADKIVEAYRAN